LLLLRFSLFPAEPIYLFLSGFLLIQRWIIGKASKAESSITSIHFMNSIITWLLII
jgi:hypothetical protein